MKLLLKLKSALPCMLALFAIFITGCAATKNHVNNLSFLTYDDLIKANSRESILSRHNSCSWLSVPVQGKHFSQNLDAYGFSKLAFYSQKDCVYMNLEYKGIKESELLSEEAVYTSTDEVWRLCKTDGSERYISAWFAMSESEIKDNAYPLESLVAITDGKAYGEKLLRVKDNKDGTLTFVTESPLESASDVQNVPESWKNASMEYRYTVNAENLELIKLSTYVCTKKEKIPYILETVSYDTLPPVECNEIRTNISALRSKKSEKTDKSRTITAVYDPGTAGEQRYSVTADISYGIKPIIRQGYKLFIDPECTVPYKGTNGLVDVTIYLKK